MPLFPDEIPTAEQSQAMHDRAQGAREVAAAYRQTCDDRDDGTPADPQTDGGLNLQIAALVEALEDLRAAFVHAWGFEPGSENALYRPILDKVDRALSSVRCLKP